MRVIAPQDITTTATGTTAEYAAKLAARHDGPSKPAWQYLPETDQAGHPCRRDYLGCSTRPSGVPATDNNIIDRLPDDSNGNNVYVMKQRPSDPGTVVHPNAVKREGLFTEEASSWPWDDI